MAVLGGVLNLSPLWAQPASVPTPVPATQPTRSIPVVRSFAEYWALPERTLPGKARLDLRAHAAYFDRDWNLLWLHDGSVAGYVKNDWVGLDLEPGGYYHITGEITLPAAELSLRHAHFEPLPDRPIPTVPVEDLTDHNRYRDQFVSIEGLVEGQNTEVPNHTLLNLTHQGRAFTAWIVGQEEGLSYDWTGSFVRLSGVYNAKITPAGQFTSLEVMVPDSDHIEFLWRLSEDPRFEAPITPINQITRADTGRLVHIQGQTVQNKVGESIILRDDSGQAQVLTAQSLAPTAGTRLEAVGYPVINGPTIRLNEAIVRPLALEDRDDPDATATASAGPDLRYTLAARVLGLAPHLANEKRSVQLDGVITWSHPESPFLYFQDSSGGIAVYLGKNHPEIPPVGSLVTLRGTTGLGEFAPVVIARSFQVNGTLDLPIAAPITLDSARTGIHEAQWVELTGYLHRTVSAATWTHLDLSTPDGDFRAVLPFTPAFQDQVGAVMRLEGVCTALTDERGRVTNIRLWVPSAEQVEIKVPVPADPFSLPALSLAEFGRFGTADYFQRHVRVAGTVTLATSDRIVLIQENGSTLRLIRRDNRPLRAGDRIEAVGLPARQDDHFALREAHIRVVSKGEPPPGTPLENPRLLSPDLIDRRVTLDGELVQAGVFGGRARLTLRTAGMLFEAHGTDPAALEPDTYPIGARLRLTGIYNLQFNDLGDPSGFHLTVDGPQSIEVREAPSWWTRDRMVKICGLLALLNFGTLLWILSLRRRLHQAAARGERSTTV